MKFIGPFDTLTRVVNYNGVIGQWGNGSPGVEDGSVPPVEALTHPMAEIVNAIAASGLTPSEADLTQLTQAIRRLRARQDRVDVPGGGVVIDASAEGKTFVMALGTRQVFTLPAAGTVATGFSLVLEVNGMPSGFQTAYVDVAGGGQISWRGSDYNPFYLIGNGETLRLISNGTKWLCQFLAQPAPVSASLTGTSGTPAVANTADWRRPSQVHTPGESAVQFGAPGATEIRLRPPVVGIYDLVHTTTVAPTAGAFVGRSGVVLEDPNSVAITSPLIVASLFFDCRQNVTLAVEQTRTIAVTTPGGSFHPAIYGGVNGISVPSGSGMRLRLVSR